MCTPACPISFMTVVDVPLYTYTLATLPCPSTLHWYTDSPCFVLNPIAPIGVYPDMVGTAISVVTTVPGPTVILSTLLAHRVVYNVVRLVLSTDNKKGRTGYLACLVTYCIKLTLRFICSNILLALSAIRYNSVDKRILLYITITSALTGAFPYAPEIVIFPAPFCG